MTAIQTPEIPKTAWTANLMKIIKINNETPTILYPTKKKEIITTKSNADDHPT